MSSLTPRLDRLDGKKNLIINGAMEFNQRGSTLNLSASNQYLMDRFFAAKTAVFTGTSTYARSTNVPTVAESDWGFSSSLLITNGTGASPGASDQYYIGYRMEGYDYSEIHGKAIAVSFWVKSSVTGTFPISFGNAANTTNYVTSYVINSANTWEKKTVKLNTTTASTWGLGDGIGLQIFWSLSAGSSLQTSQNQWNVGGSQYYSFSGATNWAGTTAATFQLTGVQLFEIGSVDDDVSNVPFSRCGKNIANELQLCQRYCQKFNASTINFTSGYTVLINTSNTMGGTFLLPVTMRASPTIANFNVLCEKSDASGTTTLIFYGSRLQPSSFGIGYDRALNANVSLAAGYTTLTISQDIFLLSEL